MTPIEVPDHIAPSLERFVSRLVELGLDTLTFGEYTADGLRWVDTERKSLAKNGQQDPSPVSQVDQAKVLLKITGEAFMGPSGLEVSDRVLSWMLHAFARQEKMTVEEAAAILDSKPDGDRFWYFMQLLDDAAIAAFAQVLEREWKKR
jgi:hypothetical protein